MLGRCGLFKSKRNGYPNKKMIKMADGICSKIKQLIIIREGLTRRKLIFVLAVFSFFFFPFISLIFSTKN